MSSIEATAPRQHAYTGRARPQLPEPSYAERIRTFVKDSGSWRGADDAIALDVLEGAGHGVGFDAEIGRRAAGGREGRRRDAAGRGRCIGTIVRPMMSRSV